MAIKSGRGWHGDPEGHAEAARARDKFNWWPLLLIPLAFFIGFASNAALGNNQISNQSQNQSQTQPGIGGGPGVICVTPTP